MGTLAGLCAELEGLIARKGGQQDSQKKEGSPMTGLQGCSEMNHTEAITIERAFAFLTLPSSRIRQPDIKEEDVDADADADNQ